MTSYEIYWNDLTPEAQERLAALNHDNVGLSPLAIIDLEYGENDEEVEADAPKYDLEWRHNPDLERSVLIRPATDKARGLMHFFIESEYRGEYAFPADDLDFTGVGLTTNPEPTQPN